MSYNNPQGIKGIRDLIDLEATASNLQDYWGSSLKLFTKLSYPLTKLTDVQKYANEIKALYPRSAFTTELKDTSKKSWSDNSNLLA